VNSWFKIVKQQLAIVGDFIDEFLRSTVIIGQWWAK
jgi:hypothetical protein